LSQPDWVNLDDEDEVKRIILTSTNFLNGSISPKVENYNQAGIISVGGTTYLKKYLDILRERYDDQVLLVDTGEFVPSQVSKNEIKNILNHFKALKYDAIHFSEKELKFINSKTVDQFKSSFLNTNIIDLKKQAPYSSKRISPYIYKKVNGVKVGIMAVTTFKNKDARKEKYLNGLYFEDPVFSILKARKKLLRKGVKVFVLLMQSYKEEDIRAIIKRLPPNSIHAIVSSSPTMLNKRILDIPVIQNPGKGQYISRVELFYDTQSKKVLTQNSVIHTPTKLCSQFFKATLDCHIEDDEFKEKKIELIKDESYKKEAARFLGIDI